MACSHETTKIYKQNPDAVYQAFLKAVPLLDNSIKIESEDAVARQIAARIPIGWYNPTAIRVMIGATEDGGTKAYVSSRFTIASLYDWGRNKNLVERLVKAAETIMLAM